MHLAWARLRPSHDGNDEKSETIRWWNSGGWHGCGVTVGVSVGPRSGGQATGVTHVLYRDSPTFDKFFSFVGSVQISRAL